MPRRLEGSVQEGGARYGLINVQPFHCLAAAQAELALPAKIPGLGPTGSIRCRSLGGHLVDVRQKGGCPDRYYLCG